MNHHPYHHLFRPAPLALALALAFGSAAVAAQSAGAPTPINISAQPLAQALNDWARQTGVQIIVQQALVSGKTAPAIAGNLTPRQALDRLLAGSGLVATQQGKAIVVKAVPPAAPVGDAGDVATLPAVTVRASGDLPAEGMAEEGYRVSNSSAAGFSERPLQDTPFSVKVLPQALLTSRGISDVGKLDQLDASVSNSMEGVLYAMPVLRGFSSRLNERRNGVSHRLQYTMGLENMERVEVLKGLSGLQSGFGAPGGSINYVTKQPKDISEVNTSFNQFGGAKVHADLGRMVNENVGIRLNAAVEQQKDHWKGVGEPRRFISGALSWKIQPDTLLDVNVEYEDRRKSQQPPLIINTNGELPVMPDPTTFWGQKWVKYGAEAASINAKLVQKLSPSWSTTLAVSHQNVKRNYGWLGMNNIDPQGNASYNYFQSNEKLLDTSFQIKVNGQLSVAGMPHDISFGYDQMKSSRTPIDGSRWMSDVWMTNIYNPIYISDPGLGPDDTGNFQKGKSRSLFFNDIVALNEKWDMHVGGRYAQISNPLDEVAPGYIKQKSAFAPAVAVVFKPSPGLSSYISYTEGLEEGGTAPLGTQNANQKMPPLVSKQMELGLKGQYGLLAWEASLFNIAQPAEYTNSANVYVQTGEQRHRGLELAVSGKLTREWTLFGSALWLDAVRKNTGDPDIEGKRPEAIVKQRLVLTAEYAPKALPGWTFSANWANTGSASADAANTVTVPGHDIFGLSLRHQRKVAGRDLTLRLGIDNLLDKRYWAMRSTTDQFYVGAPRTVWGSVSVAF